MSALPQWKCHKVVRAAKILRSGQLSDGTWQVLLEEGQPYHLLPAGTRLSQPSPDDGYFVLYDDGHVSWSPAEAFEKGYAPIPASFQDRVKAEQAELGERLNKLNGFLETPTFRSLAFIEQERLTVQCECMHTYYEILRQRIEFFGEMS